MCNLAADLWITCNNQTEVSVDDCICAKTYYTSAMDECLMCLVKSNHSSFVYAQFHNNLAHQLCSFNASASQFQQQFYNLGITQHFPLLLPNATLICWDEPHPLERRQVAKVVDKRETVEGQNHFGGDHYPDFTDKCKESFHDSVDMDMRQNQNNTCQGKMFLPALDSLSDSTIATVSCKTAAAIFDWCFKCEQDHKNDTVTWDCFCKAYNNEYGSSICNSLNLILTQTQVEEQR